VFFAAFACAQIDCFFVDLLTANDHTFAVAVATGK